MVLVEGEKGTTKLLYLKFANTHDVITGLTGKTFAGLFEALPGPGGATKAVVGTISLGDAAQARVDWVVAAGDTDTPGTYRLWIDILDGATLIMRSLPHNVQILPYPV